MCVAKGSLREPTTKQCASLTPRLPRQSRFSRCGSGSAEKRVEMATRYSIALQCRATKYGLSVPVGRNIQWRAISLLPDSRRTRGEAGARGSSALREILRKHRQLTFQGKKLGRYEE